MGQMEHECNLPPLPAAPALPAPHIPHVGMYLNNASNLPSSNASVVQSSNTVESNLLSILPFAAVF